MPRSPIAPAAPAGIAIVSLLVALAGAKAVAATPTGKDTGLPLPRYESIAAPEAHGRRGPGGDHRIDWVYRSRGLPVQVVQESDAWRRVVDPAGDQVWIHSSLLSPNRTVFVKAGKRSRVALHATPAEAAKRVAWLEPGVVASLRACDGQWRQIAVPGKAAGWVRSAEVWGGEDCRQPK